MRNPNLYTYYDKSLADINRIYWESADKNDSDSGGGSGKLKAVAICAAALLIAVPSGIFLGYKLTDHSREIAEVTQPAKPDLRSTEEKLGYVKVQIFEFADDAPLPKPAGKTSQAVVAAEAQKTADEPAVSASASKEGKRQSPPVEIKKPEKNTKTVQAETPHGIKQAVPAATALKKYSVVFEDVDPAEYAAIQKYALQYGFTPHVADSSSNARNVWRVYKINPGSKTVIGGKNVEAVKDFTGREEAVEYAKKNNFQSVIRFENQIDRKYTLRLCCGSLDESKSIARDSNVRNKIIKIIREK